MITLLTYLLTCAVDVYTLCSAFPSFDPTPVVSASTTPFWCCASASDAGERDAGARVKRHQPPLREEISIDGVGAGGA